MSSRRAKWTGLPAVTVAFAVLLSAAHAQQQPVVGKTAAVNQDAKVEGRVLEIGASVVHREKIVTDARGAVQLLFIDRTTLSIGPNSELVIDEYLFDPNRKTGQMTVSLGKGLMRFVGGQITHSGSATVKTPPATIGIRGGLVDIKVDGGKVAASNAFGVVTVSPNSGPGAGQTFSVPQGFTGTSDGTTRPVVTVTTQQQMNANTQQLQSQPGQTGGASTGTSSTAANASNRNTTTTASITPRSAPAPGSTAPGPAPPNTPAGSAGSPATGLAGTPSSSTSATNTAGGTGSNTSSVFSNPAASVFSGGLPTTVTTSTQSVQTSSSSAAAQQTQSSTNDGGGGKGPAP
jgi:hypothetical protein